MAGLLHHRLRKLDLQQCGTDGSKPRVQELWVLVQGALSQFAGDAHKASISKQIRETKTPLPALRSAQHVPRAAPFEVFFRNFEAIAGFLQDGQTLTGIFVVIRHEEHTIRGVAAASDTPT